MRYPVWLLYICCFIRPEHDVKLLYFYFLLMVGQKGGIAMLDGKLSDLFYCDERTEEFIEALWEALCKPDTQSKSSEQDEGKEESIYEHMPF